MILYSKRLISLMLLALMITLGLNSCKKDFGDINKSWDNKVYTATIPALYNGIAASMVGFDYGGMYPAFLYQNSQINAMYAATGYRMDNMSGAFWNNYYSALANYRKLEEMIDTDANAANMTNVKAMAKVLMAYKTIMNTLYYGDMPYTDAGKGFISADYFRPKYDAQQDVIKAALAELKWAIDNFSTNSTQVVLGSGDVIFANDIAKWIKFANSLRLRYAMVLLQKAPDAANPIITEALSKPLLDANEVCGLYPGLISNLVIDRGGSYRGNAYIRMGSTMWDAMSSTQAPDASGIYDLRCKIFFEPNAAGVWAPYPQVPSTSTPAEIGNSGINDPYSEGRLTTYMPAGASWIYSPINVFYACDKTFPQLMITGSEVCFLKAEIYNKGIGVAANPATAQSNYLAGITESVKFWHTLANGSAIWTVNKPEAAPTDAELTAMLTNPQVAYSSSPATALQQIYKQHWIALYHQPFDAWTLARRTGYATPSVPLAPTSPAYNCFRITYPQSEIDGNYDHWTAITGGSDAPTVKPWFMQ